MSDSRRLTVAVVQLPATRDASENAEAVRPLVAEAAGAGAQLVVLPEAVMQEFGKPDDPLDAQALDGPFVRHLAELARRYELTIVAGIFETSDDPHGRPYNTLVVLDPAGRLQTTYRKTYLYDSFGFRESDKLLAGDGTPVVMEVEGFRLGLMTCYDLRFPEWSRRLVDAGADVLVLPAAWLRGPQKEAHWETLATARAIENTTYVVASAQSGRTYSGRSGVIDPMGTWLASLGNETGCAIAQLRGDRLAETRETNPSLDNRRDLA